MNRSMIVPERRSHAERSATIFQIFVRKKILVRLQCLGCPTLLEECFAEFQSEHCGGFSMSYLTKLWCTLTWIEQYWNDTKNYCANAATTRQG
jgi:hypothetical protein